MSVSEDRAHTRQTGPKFEGRIRDAANRDRLVAGRAAPPRFPPVRTGWHMTRAGHLAAVTNPIVGSVATERAVWLNPAVTTGAVYGLDGHT